MLQHRSRAPVPGATLPRLLARLEALEPVQPTQAPADLLGDWLDWQRAVALSRALDDVPQAPEPEAAEHAGMTPDGTASACGPDAPAALASGVLERRAALVDAIEDDARDWTRPLRPRPGEDGMGAAAGAGAVQRHCQGLQRDLQSAVGRLRGELREQLAQRGGGKARLAAVDAVMEGLLAPREHALLVPVVPALVARFERLHALNAGADAGADAGAGAAAPVAPAGWRDRFRAEARQVLLAELDLRFQPIEALLAALRSPGPDA